MASLLAALALALGPARPASGATVSTSGPWFGVLQPPTSGLDRLAAAGVSRATLELGWDSYEPKPKEFAVGYVAEVKARAKQLRANGIGLVLDLGLQYPPSWVFTLPGPTRFQNQYGEQWHASIGEDVPNAVFNTAVRAVQARYLQRVARDFADVPLVAVRVGGLLYGELRYPAAHYRGHANALWMFDAAALAKSPHPAWRPGQGTEQQALAMLRYYTRSLTGYQTFLLDRVARAFPKPRLQVLFPGWGLRPGQIEEAARGKARGTTVAERGDTLAYGLDWAAQVPVLTRWAPRADVYTTWLDAESGGNTPQYQSPVEYLVSLAKPRGLPVSGENTGNQTARALALSSQRVRALGLTGMMWMTGRELVSGTGRLRLSDYAAAIKTVRASG